MREFGEPGIEARHVEYDFVFGDCGHRRWRRRGLRLAFAQIFQPRVEFVALKQFGQTRGVRRRKGERGGRYTAVDVAHHGHQAA